jgi:2-iminobutanoate/2-iminopropanoate deaminase
MTQRTPRSISIPGVTHGNTPIPMGARVGNMLFSGGISGKDPSTGELPDDAAAQVRFAFANLRTLLEQGGATLQDVARLTVFVRDDAVRELINHEWLQCFPDPDDRPARHTQVQALRGKMLLQLDVIAVLDRA